MNRDAAMTVFDPPALDNAPPRREESTSLTLLKKLQAKDPSGWDRLNKLYGPFINCWCARAGVNSQDFADVRQQVYLVVASKIAEFRRGSQTGSFRAWLRSITRNQALDHSRKVRRQAIGTGGDEGIARMEGVADGRIDDDDDPEELVTALLHRALEFIRLEFSARDWRLFQLVVIKKEDQNRIAQRMRLKPNTVRQVVCRIRRRLHAELGEQW
jgi:RNA polymerase sigma-70 factor, ECF subfamily